MYITINCKYGAAATLYCKYIIVNTLYKGGGGGDDDCIVLW